VWSLVKIGCTYNLLRLATHYIFEKSYSHPLTSGGTTQTKKKQRAEALNVLNQSQAVAVISCENKKPAVFQEVFARAHLTI
jgi:hypothetical protein